MECKQRFILVVLIQPHFFNVFFDLFISVILKKKFSPPSLIIILFFPLDSFTFQDTF